MNYILGCEPRNSSQMKTATDIQPNLDQDLDINFGLSDRSSSIMDSFDPTYSFEFLELNAKH